MKNNWLERIRLADRYFQEWEDLFKCKNLIQYYENFQWRNFNALPMAIRPYVVNLIYPAIETKISNILLHNPQFDITSKPRFSDWNQEEAFASAEIKQDALNTIIENPNLNFVDNIRLAALDHFFYFSVIETGYAADWANPNKQAPIMKSDLNKDIEPGSEKDKVDEDIELPLDERVYFKWIPGRRFRVSVADSPFLANCAWCGYYSYFYRSVLENIKDFKYDKLGYNLANPQFSPEYAGPSHIVGASSANEDEDPDLQYLIRNNEVYKIWTIWDNRTKRKVLVHHDTGDECWEDLFDYIPLATHRSVYRLKGWYPIPPVWYWISPQDEVNEAREQMRNYRRRYKRKFQYVKGKVTPIELDKLSSDVDGESIEVKEFNAISPIPNPEIGVTITAELSQGLSDFNHVSGTAQIRESDRETATKSKIISTKEEARENVERISFDSFVCRIGRLGLTVMTERLTLPIWIKYTTDPSENFLGEVQAKGPAYRLIHSTQLDDGYDFTVDIRVKNATPAQMEQELQKFIAFMSLVTQFPEIKLSPVLIREAAYKSGYRNEKVIKEMQQAALLQKLTMMGGMTQALGMGGGNGGVGPGMNNQNAAKSALNNSNPNPMNEIMNQLNSQV